MPFFADIDNAGGFSFYGTMAQSGNVFEWEETAFDSVNNSSTENREFRGGAINRTDVQISASTRNGGLPGTTSNGTGFRVAGSVVQVPEPSSFFS